MDLARYFIDERGQPAALFRHRGAGARQSIRLPWYHRIYEYNQSHVPVREQDKVVGMRCERCICIPAMADLAAEDADQRPER